MTVRDCVLVVEDDHDISVSMVEVLEDCGYRAISAPHGRAALEMLRTMRPRPCVILLDVMMPVVDGWTFREAQLAEPELATIPVIVITAHTNAEWTAKEMKANGFLRKPVRIQTLLDMIAQFHVAPAVAPTA